MTLREVSKIAVNCQRLNSCCHIPARPLQITAPGVCASNCDLLECVTAALCNDVTQGTTHVPEFSGVPLKQPSFPSPSTHTHLHTYTCLVSLCEIPRNSLSLIFRSQLNRRRAVTHSTELLP